MIAYVHLTHHPILNVARWNDPGLSRGINVHASRSTAPAAVGRSFGRRTMSTRYDVVECITGGIGGEPSWNQRCYGRCQSDGLRPNERGCG